MDEQKPMTPKQVAYHDISEDCKKRKEGQNYLPFEKDILESLDIAVPDFRQFNGGHNKKYHSKTK